MAESSSGSSSGGLSHLLVLILALLGGSFIAQQSSSVDVKPTEVKSDSASKHEEHPSLAEVSVEQSLLEPLREFLGVGLPKQSAEATAKTTAKTSEASTDDTEATATDNANSMKSVDDFWSQADTQRLLTEVRRQVGELEFLIVSVADPIETKVNYRFDEQLDALQKALAAEKYLLDRFQLPWEDKKSLTRFRAEPAVLLFRKDGPLATETEAAKTNLLQVFLVGETPTAGLHDLAFLKAVDQIRHLARLTKTDAGEPNDNRLTISVSGPVFSGGADSLARSVRHCLETFQELRFEIINGSAVGVEPKRFLQLARYNPKDPESVKFSTTLHNGQLLRHALIQHIRRRTLARSPKIAWLTESGTGYGAALTPPRTASRPKDHEDNHVDGVDDDLDGIFEFRFPASISRVRSERELHAQGGTQPKNTLGPPGYRVPIPYDDSQTARDFPKVMTPRMTAPSAEIVLGQILATIRNEGIEFVGISATDVRDPVFIAEMIREQSPDVQILLVTADLLYLHPQYRAKLHGALIASSHSLFPEDQDWCFPFTGAHKKIFSHQSLYGFYNSIALLRGLSQKAYKPADGAALDIVDVAHANTFLPIAYGMPLMPLTAGAEFVPPVWISMIGPTGIWPINCLVASDLKSSIDAKSGSVKELGDNKWRTLQPDDYLIKIRYNPVPSADTTGRMKPSYDPRIAPSTWIAIWLWLVLGIIMLLAAGGVRLGNWAQPLRLGKAPFGWHRNASRAGLAAPRHFFRFLVALAIDVPVTCFAVLLAIPFVVPGADWDQLELVVVGAALIIATLTAIGLTALVVFDAIAFLATMAPCRCRSRPLLNLSLLVCLVVLAAVAWGAHGLLAVRPAAMLLTYVVSTDTWNGVSMILPAELTVGAFVVLGYGMLHQCYLLQGSKAVLRPVWPPPTRSLIQVIAASAEVQDLLLFPIKRRFRMLKSNWLYIGLPVLAVLWLAWLALNTANTQLLPLPIDVTCIAFIIACSLWFVRFSKIFEICRQLSFDLESFTKNFSDPLAKWTSILQRLGSAEHGGLATFWSRQVPARLDRMDHAAQRLAKAKQGGQPQAIGAAAEELYALQVEAYARQVFRHVFRLFSGLMLSACLLLLTAESFPFNTEPLLRLTTATMLFGASLVVCWYYVKFDRQRLISLMAGTPPGQAELNWNMLQTVVPPLALGLVAMLGQVFPEIWNWAGALFEPLSRSTG